MKQESSLSRSNPENYFLGSPTRDETNVKIVSRL
jgi:hypothetical protein